MIEWTQDLSVGNEAIDSDHRKLVDLINRYVATLATHNVSEVHDVFRELEKYTFYHFAREEALLAKWGYDGLDEHRAAHEALVENLRDFSDRQFYGSASKGEGEEAQAFLKSWLFDHVRVEDHKYADALKLR